MTMQNKICFLLLGVLLIIVQAVSYELYNPKGSSALDHTYATAAVDDDDDDDIKKDKYYPKDDKYDRKEDKYYPKDDKYDRKEDKYSQQSTYSRNRYPSYSPPTNKYRPRSRWSPSYENSYESNDRSHYGSGLNNLLSDLLGPFPPAFFDDGPYLSNGPSCYPLLDPQYPLFSDMCGAVPQARYSLPNAFGHIERWQIAQVLTAILGPATPTSAIPTCTRSLRLLICPLLFPPCPTRYEAPPVLPCQSFCRVVKNQCAAPSLDLLPCDLLPPVSDLCPINPTPFGPVLPPFGPPPFGPQSFGPQSFGPQSFGPQSFGPQSFGPQSFGPQPFGPQSFGPQPFGPQSFGPQPFGPQSFGPQSFGPQSFGPQSFGPQSFGPPPPFMGGFSSQPGSSGAPPFGAPPSTYSSAPGPSRVPSPAPSSPPPRNGVPPSSYSPGASSFGLSSSPFSSMPSSSGLPPIGTPSFLSPSAITLSPFHQLLNSESYLSDSLTPILVDFPPLGFQTPNYRHHPRFLPSLRSGTEQV